MTTAADPLVDVTVFKGTEQCAALLRWAEAHQITPTDGGDCSDPECGDWECYSFVKCRVPRHLIATLPPGWDWE